MRLKLTWKWHKSGSILHIWSLHNKQQTTNNNILIELNWLIWRQIAPTSQAAKLELQIIIVVIVVIIIIILYLLVVVFVFVLS